MKTLLKEYNAKEKKTLEDILDFHVKFERIHPFQDGNGRVGRLKWDREKGYLTDTCLTAQNKYKTYLDYFGIAY